MKKDLTVPDFVVPVSLGILGILLGILLFKSGLIAYNTWSLEGRLDKVFVVGNCLESIPEKFQEKCRDGSRYADYVSKRTGDYDSSQNALYYYEEGHMKYYLITDKTTSCSKILSVFKER